MSISFTDEQTKRVVAAIRQAEKRTSAEIFAVLADSSDTYRFVGYSFFALWILLISTLCALYFFTYQPSLFGWDFKPAFLLVFVAAQLAAFLCGMLVLRVFPNLAIAVTPDKILQDRCHANAVRQFLAHGIHTTTKRSGVLIFISLSERYGEILIDGEIEIKLGRELFLKLVEEMTEMCRDGLIIDAYVQTVDSLAEILEEPFPFRKNQKNELEDKMVILV